MKVQRAERFNAGDESYREKIKSKNALQNYANELRDALEDEEISSKLTTNEKKREDATEEVTVWLDYKSLKLI